MSDEDSRQQFVEIFDEMGAEKYDGNNGHVAPVHINLHFLNMLVLKDLPKRAKILCVGVGTGEDIIQLATANENWTFVGIDPSETMLAGCQAKLEKAGLSGRCSLFHGFLSDYRSDETYDAVLCLFVMHFVADMKERHSMYADMYSYLKDDGTLIVSEISHDFDAADSHILVDNWKELHRHAGAPKENLSNMRDMLQNQLAVLPAEVTEEMMRTNGFKNPTEFFQSFLIRAWHARK